MDEIIAMVPVAIYFRKNSHLDEIFNKKLAILKSSGLVEYWTNNFLDQKYLKIKDEPKGPKKLNVTMLSGGFQLVILGWFSSFLLFLYEFTNVKLKLFFKLVKTMFEKIYLLPLIIRFIIRKIKEKLK